MLFIGFSATAIVTYLLLYVYYVRSAYRPIRTPSEERVFYTSTMITSVPICVYTINIITLLTDTTLALSSIMPMFFIEWTITTPLIVYSIVDSVHLELYKRVLLCSLTAIMNICGYVAARVQDPVHVTAAYVSGCTFFLLLCISLARIYVSARSLYKKDATNAAFLTYLTYLTYSVTMLWWAYPIAFALYKYGVIDIEYAYLAFISLDVITKGAFIASVIRYREMLALCDSFTNQILPRITQVAPMPLESPTVSVVSVSDV